MTHGIKVSLPGFNIDGDENENVKAEHENDTLRFMVSALAMPFLKGAWKSVARYSDASLKTKNMSYVFDCVHEASLLLEDLDTIDRYVIMCGKSHVLHDKILNMRNHIRHDLRDNLSKENNKGRKARSIKLGIEEGMMVSIYFDSNSISIGNQVLQVSEVKDFLVYAENVFDQLLNTALNNGRLEHKGFKNE